MAKLLPFDRAFEALTGMRPLSWQVRLFDRLMRREIPSGCDLPTGLGKTSVMTIWLIARAQNAVRRADWCTSSIDGWWWIRRARKRKS